MKQKRFSLKIATLFFIGCFLFPTLLSIAQSGGSQPQEIISSTNSGDWDSPGTYTSLSEPDVAIDSKGNWHMVYYEHISTYSAGGHTTYVTLNIKYLSSKIPTPVTVASLDYPAGNNPLLYFNSPSIAVDSQDNLHIMYGQDSYSWGAGFLYNAVYSVWYVQLQLPLEILDGSDFSAGPEVSSEPAELASGGTAVEGAVTDGVTRLLLRLSVDKSGPVTFTLQGTGNPKEDGVLRSINNSLQKDNAVTVNTVEVNGKQYAFVIYQAPENFVRKSIDNDYNGKPDDETASERTISIKVEYNNAASIEKQIRLVRPPIILVHGLWSSKKMWRDSTKDTDFKRMLRENLPGLRILISNYPNSIHFADNKNVPYECKGGIQDAKEKLHSQKIAMVQADILGHSMGGILARIWAGAGDYVYNRDENFWMGDINKLITLDSPHYGSFFADAGLACFRGPHSLKAHLILTLMEKVGLSITKGAADDLMTTSEPIKKVNATKIISPSHAIVGDFIVTIVPIVPYTEPDDSKDFMVMGLPADYFNLHNMLIQEGYGDSILSNLRSGSDLVVSTHSQRGGLEADASDIFNHHHMAATTQDAANKTIELLNTDTQSNLFNLGFPKSE